MLIISGGQQGLDLVAKVFATRLSETMLFEDPTYPGAISLFKAKHFCVPWSPMDRAWSSWIKRSASRSSCFYTMPSVHNPTGIAYSPEKKAAVAERARHCPFYIIEGRLPVGVCGCAGPALCG